MPCLYQVVVCTVVLEKKQDVLFLPVNLTIKYLDVVSVLIMKHMNVLFIKLLLDRTLLLKCELFVV